MTVIDRRTGRPIPLPPGAPRFSYVHALLQDRHGAIWIGQATGLVKYDHQAWTSFTKGPDVPVGRALSLAEDRDGRLWIGIDRGWSASTAVTGKP